MISSSNTTDLHSWGLSDRKNQFPTWGPRFDFGPALGAGFRKPFLGLAPQNFQFELLEVAQVQYAQANILEATTSI